VTDKRAGILPPPLFSHSSVIRENKKVFEGHFLFKSLGFCPKNKIFCPPGYYFIQRGLKR
jgi:hypothetical protein